MKKYDVEIKRNSADCWDCEAVQDHIDAGSEDEAIEIARDYLKDQCDTAAERESIDALIMRAIEQQN